MTEWSIWNLLDEQAVVLADDTGRMAKFHVEDVLTYSDKRPPFGFNPFLDLTEMVTRGLRPYAYEGAIPEMGLIEHG